MGENITTKKVNEYQAEKYKASEQNAMQHYLNIYKNLIKEMSNRKNISILDLGGGAGYFSRELLSRLPADVDVNICLLDMKQYDTWNDEDSRLHFYKGDAFSLDKIFKGKKFDYVFCNMLFHHLLGSSFSESRKIREKCLNNIAKVLKDDGKIGIIDNYNDGFIIDSISCRIIYFLTTIKNPIMIKICKLFHSYSAGIGVCMLSEKMWNQLIEKCNLKIIDLVVTKPYNLGLFRKICLLNKSYREFNLMVLQKQTNM